MSIKKLIGIVIFVSVILVAATQVLKPKAEQTTMPEKQSIVATFYPLAEFSRQVAGDKIPVLSLVPTGVEPHDFEPKPQDLIKVRNANVVVYNGQNFEPWLEKVISQNENKNQVFVKASENLELIDSDPHVWLDPVLAQQIVANIGEQLKVVDPQNAEEYESNVKAYQGKLAQLDARYKNELSNCQRRDLVTSHNAFAYVAKRYNLNVISVSGVSPDEEPSPTQIAQIIDQVRQKDIKYILFESLVSPRISDTIAKEVGAQTLVFNPLEGLTDEEIAQGDNYLSVQNKNIDTLKIALQCL